MEEKGVAAFYDKTAQDWADAWYPNESMLPVLQAFVLALPPKPRVLDLGCGAGYETMRLAGLGAEAVGVDISGASLAIARARNPQLAFYRMDMRRLDDALGRFDGVIALASLIHIDAEDLPRVFAQVLGRLQPGGAFWAIYFEGDGYDEARSVKEIDGVHYDRRFLGHRPQTLLGAAATAGLCSPAVIDLPESERQYGWRGLSLRKPGP